MSLITLRYDSRVYEKVVNKEWGRELVFCNNEQFAAKLLIVKPGYQSSLHYHVTKSELFILFDGDCKLELPAGIRNLKTGDRQLIESGMEHRFSSKYGAVILEVSSHHDDVDVVRIEPSRRIPSEEDNQSGTQESVPASK